MAPLQIQDKESLIYHLARFTISTNEGYDRPKQHLRILKYISLSFGLLSLMSIFFAFYWFVKMNRSFRHDLIMLLIQSDFIKSLWFVVFPIVDYFHGPIASNSAFCQASGFFLMVGIESSDIAVLLIAVHSAMCIYRPRSGLYPYRRLAYAAYIVFPLLIASLAFVDGRGYDNVGQYCYLQNDEGWTRKALSWIPRYIICTVIVITYVCIYVYVRRRMLLYGRRGSGASVHQDRGTGDDRDVPPTPPIECHGLIPSTPSIRRASSIGGRGTGRGRQRSVSSISTIPFQHDGVAEQRKAAEGPNEDPIKKLMSWQWPGTQHSTPPQNDKIVPEASEDRHPPKSADLDAPPQIHMPLQRDYRTDVSSTRTSHSRPLSSVPGDNTDQGYSTAEQSRKEISVPKTSLPNIFLIPRQGPPSHMDEISSPVSSPTILSSPGGIDASNVAKNREKIRRQLRSLFVYPLVYMVIWVFPFISHAMGLDDNLTARDPFWLLILSMVSLCIQGAVDCALFTAREKPWKHTRGGFFEGLKSRFKVNLTAGWKRSRVVGRTKEEMLVDSRIARARRLEEIAAERAVREDLAEEQAQKREARNWWDMVDISPGESNEE